MTQPALRVTTRARAIAVSTATNVYDAAVKLFRDNPSAAAYATQERAALALQTACCVNVGDPEQALIDANAAIETAARDVHHVSETRAWIQGTEDAHGAVPATLNGYAVRAKRPRDGSNGGGYVVLVQRDHSHHPWVTACWFPTNPEGWTWGHYFADEDAAREDFHTR